MSIFEFIVKNPSNVIFGILAGVATVLIVSVGRFYRRRRDYPPGPFPLPLIGTTYIFLTRNKKEHWMHQLMDMDRKHGKVYTAWMGHTPQVVITDPKIIVEIMKKHTYAGRPQFKEMMKMFMEDQNDTSTDVATSDFNPEWEVLRKVTHSALRRYAVSDRLPVLVSQVVDDILEEIHTKEGDAAFDITRYLFLTLYTILSSSAFGKRYRFDDPELLAWIERLEAQSKFTGKVMLLFIFPPLRFIFRGTFNLFRDNISFQKAFAKKKYDEHVETFDGVNIRDFTDALLMAKKEAEEEEKESQKYLHPMNIMNSVTVLFSAGSETSRLTLMWCFLFLANYPALQKQIRDEIEQTIGSEEIPCLDHRKQCPLTAAFIAEVMRFRPIVPFGVAHKSMVDSEINGHPVKADTLIMFGLYRCLQDKDIWGDPEVFRPERFLNPKGDFMSKPNPYFVPFSVGRRSCPGDKLALADMFFILARFLQKTKGMTIQLENGPGSVDLNADPKKSGGIIPHDFKIKLVKNV